MILPIISDLPSLDYTQIFVIMREEYGSCTHKPLSVHAHVHVLFLRLQVLDSLNYDL